MMNHKIWNGRLDGEEKEHHRLFQRVLMENDWENIQQNDFVLQGFAVDEGVRRNKGRVGAKDAPNIIRQNMANFPVFSEYFRLLDFGNVVCENKNLEESQENLAQNVQQLLRKGAKSVVLGGGHELTFAHYSGIKKAFPNQKIGVINFDAHFDNRQPSDAGASSGTGFYQIAEKDVIHSLHLGIQRNSNTKALFDFANKKGMQYILADDLHFGNHPKIIQQIDEFIQQIDVLYVTICMDVFNASIAPGVSALAYNGIFADAFFMKIYRYILQQNKIKALDVAEVNPQYDIQHRTARLAGSLVNEFLMTRK